jgi:hypothetical protein
LNSLLGRTNGGSPSAESASDSITSNQSIVALSSITPSSSLHSTGVSGHHPTKDLGQINSGSLLVSMDMASIAWGSEQDGLKGTLLPHRNDAIESEADLEFLAGSNVSATSSIFHSVDKADRLPSIVFVYSLSDTFFLSRLLSFIYSYN